MDDQLLETYLNDHLAAATGGVSLARRARDAHADLDAELHELLTWFHGQIAEDREQIVRALDLIGGHRDPVKVVAGAVGEVVGRLKTNRRIVKRSPLSSLIELEGLSVAVHGKSRGWIVLRALEHPKLTPIDFGALLRRADEQQERIEAARRRVGARVFAGGAPRA
ncbi:hypothetical protein ACVU7I_19165 [Patulibacter sp. S7RM1-6]